MSSVHFDLTLVGSDPNLHVVDGFSVDAKAESSVSAPILDVQNSEYDGE